MASSERQSANEIWSDFRRMMPVVENWAYFDHAAVAPMTRAALDVYHRWVRDVAENGAVNWPAWRKEIEKARKLGAKLLGAERDEIALVHNTTEGINIVAEGFPWQPGDNVVTLASEFPSNRFPWMNLSGRGVEARVIPVESEQIDLQRIAAACDSRTRIVSISWVGYATGWRNDLESLVELVHGKGALLFLDAIQGLGVFPLNVSETPIDFLAADGHKWLLGPEGAGFFYTRREHLDMLRPIGLGWNSADNSGDFSESELNLKASAGRYEGGTYNVGGIAALAASLENLLKFDVERIARRLLDVTDRLCDQLERIGAEIASCREGDRRSGIVAFDVPNRDPAIIRRHCQEQQVIVNCRGGRIRVSPHVYTDELEIERLIDVLRGAG